MTRRQGALVLWLALPVIVVALLCYAIAVSLTSRESQAEQFPAIGAGAGDTGGANAFGEAIAGNAANHGVKEVREAKEASEAAAAADERSDSRIVEAESLQRELVQPEALDQGYILIVEDKARRSSAASPIYLAGTPTAWAPAEPRWKLEAQSDMRWRIHVPASANRRPVEFKFTRGSWELEELNAEMKPPANRTLSPVDVSRLKAGEPPVIELAVEHWGDERQGFEAANASDPYRAVSATGMLRRLPVSGGAAGSAGGVRELLVWLPPGYDDRAKAGERYPVLYMHDGQNLFEKLPSVPGEWKMDETAQSLIEQGRCAAFIVVGIPHGGATRTSEYLPVAAVEGVEPRGDAHVEWLLQEVMPRVERTFRVATGPEHTGIGGSSLGAVMALHAASLHPDRFGLVLAESLPLKTGNEAAWDAWTAGLATWPRRIYLGVGERETGDRPGAADMNAGYVEKVRGLHARMKSEGMGPDRLLLVVAPGAEHTESAWAARLPDALRFLFPSGVDTSK